MHGEDLRMQWPKQRGWGWYATLIRTPWFCLKLLRFKPYGALSMQRHAYRTEVWWFIRGRGGFKSGDATGWMLPRSIWKIQKDVWHKFNAQYQPIYVIELQYGRKVTENDIERK